MPGSNRKVHANNQYLVNGIVLNPSVPSVGDNVRIIYDGLLAKNGASHIYAHIGYGDSWDKKSYHQMTKSSMAFEASFPVEDSDTLNVCFKDCANNWDNNSGKNYSFEISK